MKHVYIEHLQDHIGETVTIKGWVFHRRSSGKLKFIEVRDGTGIVQCVIFKGNVPEEQFQSADNVSLESSVIIEGSVREDKRAPGGCEIDVQTFHVHHHAEDYPITPKEHGEDFLLDRRHLWIRSKRQNAILRVRHTIVKAIRDFFDERGFVLFDAPILTPNAVEGTSTLFETSYFDLGSAYLTQSGQLYGEAGALALGKIYVFGPTFRAEKSKTRRHLTEFWMVEPEMAWYDLNDDMDLAEEFIEYVVQTTLDKRSGELEVLERDLSKLECIQRPFPRISYDEAVAILHKHGKEFDYGNDFGAPDETLISGQFDRPVIVHRYPAEVKAFYMKRDPEDETKALAMDMLAPEGYGEIIGGSQREDDYDTLVRRIREHNLPQDVFEWYLDLRRYGSVPHSGFGLGLERTVAWICKLDHIRETIPFPRTIKRKNP
ncbi:MAG: asparagine--tRNA ligase [Chlorobi bacterium]|nr:asparagine--tRNA ligase [Chlorobiota bacterium]